MDILNECGWICEHVYVCCKFIPVEGNKHAILHTGFHFIWSYLSYNHFSSSKSGFEKLHQDRDIHQQIWNIQIYICYLNYWFPLLLLISTKSPPAIDLLSQKHIKSLGQLKWLNTVINKTILQIYIQCDFMLNILKLYILLLFILYFLHYCSIYHL